MSRTAFRLSLICGLAVLGLSLMSLLQSPTRACGGLPDNYAPIIAFELARTQSDLDALFGADASECRATLIGKLDLTNVVDAVVFVPVYGAFLLFFFTGMRQRDSRASAFGIAFTVAAIATDYLENLCLMQLTPQLDASSFWFSLLPWATGAKWLALGVVSGIAAWSFASRLPRQLLLALMCVPGLLVALSAAFAPSQAGPLLSSAIGLGWVAFLIFASTESFGGAGQPQS